MLKIIAATLVFAASTAGASPAKLSDYASRACASVAEVSVSVARSAELGLPWKNVEDLHARTHTNHNNAYAAVLVIHREAYYGWAGLSPSTVRTLAYTKCMQDLPDAVREDSLK